MKKICFPLAAVLLLVASSAPAAQSLGDLAKKEKERREKLEAKGKVITNDDTAKYRNGAITTVSLPPGPEKAASDKTATDKPASTNSGTAKAQTTDPDEPVDFEGRPESYWRQTFADARKKAKELESEANVLTLKIADLQNQFYREADGFRQQQIQREIQKAFYEQDLNKEKLAKSKDMIQDLEKEARKSGALPGWLLEKNQAP
jgi:hypothetical protein